jgi:hypothetical protein
VAGPGPDELAAEVESELEAEVGGSPVEVEPVEVVPSVASPEGPSSPGQAVRQREEQHSNNPSVRMLVE